MIHTCDRCGTEFFIDCEDRCPVCLNPVAREGRPDTTELQLKCLKAMYDAMDRLLGNKVPLDKDGRPSKFITVYEEKKKK